LLPFSRIL